MDNEIRPALGSPESAVLAFVNVLANAMEVREEQLAYWLDCYYQLRLHYEQTCGRDPDDTVLHRSDLEPVIRQLWQETLKKSCREEAGKRLAARVAEPAAPEAEEPALATNANKAAAIFKRETKRRLEEARGQGMTIAAAVREGKGSFTENELMTALDGGKLPIETWRAIAEVLDRWKPFPIMTS